MQNPPHVSPHFPTYFDDPLKHDDAIARELWEIRRALKRLHSLGMSESVVNQSLRGILGSFWEARAVRYRVQHELRPWSREAKLSRSKQDDAPRDRLTYEHSIPMNMLAQALLAGHCDEFTNFQRLLMTLSIPCIITQTEDDRITQTKSGGRSLRDCMPREFAALSPWEWPLSALDARYQLAEIEFDEGEWPSQVIARLLRRFDDSQKGGLT